MLTWADFRNARPDLAEAGRELLYQFGVGLAFLSTVRKDGGPRVHPMCPLVVDGRLLAFLIPSPKANDLKRDPRFAMHSFSRPNDEDAFYITGHASLHDGADFRERAATQFWQERQANAHPPEFDQQLLFEFFVETAMLTRTTGHGDPDPQHTIWHAGR